MKNLLKLNAEFQEQIYDATVDQGDFLRRINIKI